ncbi:hypothetical protein Tco_1193313 [Tanacetum coccineum]
MEIVTLVRPLFVSFPTCPLLSWRLSGAKRYLGSLAMYYLRALNMSITVNRDSSVASFVASKKVTQFIPSWGDVFFKELNAVDINTYYPGTSVEYEDCIVLWTILLKCPGAPHTQNQHISFGICPIALCVLANFCVTQYSLANASKVPYLVALVAPLVARAIVVEIALVALGQGSPIRLPFTRSHVVDFGDILPFEGLLLVTMEVLMYLSNLLGFIGTKLGTYLVNFLEHVPVYAGTSFTLTFRFTAQSLNYLISLADSTWWQTLLVPQQHNHDIETDSFFSSIELNDHAFSP